MRAEGARCRVSAEELASAASECARRDRSRDAFAIGSLKQTGNDNHRRRPPPEAQTFVRSDDSTEPQRAIDMIG
jgi:hypothetical protein